MPFLSSSMVVMDEETPSMNSRQAEVATVDRQYTNTSLYHCTRDYARDTNRITSLEEETTVFPQPYTRTLSRWSTATTVGSGLLSHTMLFGDVPRKKPIRFRSATVAIDAGLASFNAYRKGKNRRGKG